MLALAATTGGTAGTPAISGLNDFAYTEQQSSPVAATGSVTLTSGTSYADRYLEFSVTAAQSTETLAVQTVGSPNTTAGAVSVVGTDIYLGLGGTAKIVGSIDGTLNGLNGAALRLNFSSPLANGYFDAGSASWTINANLVTLGALATLTDNERAPSGTPSFSSSIVDEGGARGNVLRLLSNGSIVGPSNVLPYGSMFGPEALSAPFDAYAGDSLAVDWKAEGGGDDYEVYGFLVNTLDDAHTLLFHGRGTTQAWTTATGTIPANGNFRFRFVSGSYDASGGLVLGASLYIDNVRVFGNDASDAVATNLARLVNYANTSQNPGATRTLNFTAVAADDSSTSDAALINITLVDDPPSLTTTGGSAAYVEDAAAAVIDAAVTISDPDGGNITGATIAIGTGFVASEDQLQFTTQNGITGSYSSTTGILTLSGTTTNANYQTALRSVGYLNTSQSPNTTTRAIAFSLGGDSLFFSTTGHYYEFVPAAGISWTAAQVRAEDTVSYGTAGYPAGVFGLQGYLVTIGSAAENNFAASKIAGVQGWIGASDATVEGTWRWVVGPESGALLSASYEGWAGGEPNNAGNEDYAHFLTNGQWNDLPDASGSIAGYVVEYGGMAGDPAVVTTASRNVTVTTVNDVPSDIALSNSSVNQTAGANASVGTLSSTDVDNGAFTYTLVAGAGSTNNASFNISGASLRANNATLLAGGTYSVRVQSDDGSTGTFAEAFTITVVDNIAPAAPSTPDLDAASDSGTSNTDNITSDNTPAVSGTAEAGSTVRLYRAGAVLLGSATATGGNWTITSSALTDGTYSLTAIATDAANNTGPASSALSVTIDTSAPAAPPTPDLAVASDTGVSTTDNLTNDTTPTFTGTAEANSAVRLYRAGGTQIGMTTADGGGAWAITSDPLADGTHSITAQATDTSGNASPASGALSITVDATAPATPAAADLDVASDSGISTTDNLTNDTTPAFSGTAEANSIVELFRAGSVSLGTATADGSGAWSFTSPTLADGVHSITIQAADAAGNTSSASSALDLTIDATAPTAPATPDLDVANDTGPSVTDNITNDSTPTISGTAEAASTVELFRTGTVSLGSINADGSGAWSITSSVLADGTHSITVKATDAAGNISPASSALSVRVDTIAASTVGIVRHTPSAVNVNGNVIFRVQFDDDVAGVDTSDFALVTNNTATGTISVVTPVSGPFYDVTVSSVSGNGEMRLDLDGSGTGITDIAGNAISGGFTSGETYTLDTVGPVILGPLEYSAQWGGSGNANGQFFQPYGIAVDRGLYVYVADTFNHRVQKFAANGTFVLSFGAPGAGAGAFNAPYGVAVDAVGNVYVADGNNHRIQKFAPDGTFMLQFGSNGAANGQFFQPRSVAVDAAGNIYVADFGNHRVQKFDATGAYVTKWGGLGVGNGQMNQPFGVAVDAAGNVYVADTGNNRVQKFTDVGAYVSQWGSFGTTEGKFNLPNGVAVDQAGNVYVADTRNNRVQKFDATGVFLSTFGSFGTADGQFYYPSALSLDPSGRAFVADTLNNRVEMLTPFAALANAPADGRYRATQNLDCTLEYSTAVVVTGSPQIALTIGSSNVYATYFAAGSSGATVVFRYTVQPGDTDTDGIAIATSLSLNGGTIRDVSGNDAIGSTFTVPALTGVIVDTSVPAMPSTPDLLASSDSGASTSDDITSDTTPTFSGTAEVGSTVTLYADAVAVGTAVATSGSWTITSSARADATYAISATATDVAGNTSAASAALNVTIDNTDPAAPSAPDLSAADDSGSANNDNITGVATPTFTGTAESGSVVTLYADGSLLGTATATGGNWSIISATLSDGTHAITAKATDASGSTGVASAALNVTIDATVPMVPAIVSFSDDTGISNSDAITSDTTPTLSGTAEANATVTISLTGTGVLGTAAANGGGAWTYVVSALSAGSHAFTATATDAAGNTSAISTPLAVSIDTTAPAATAIVRKTPSTALTNSATLVFTITFDATVGGVDAADFALTTNGTAVGTVSGVAAVSGAVYDVTVSAVSGNGDLRLDLNASATGITDVPGNAIMGGFAAGESYAIDTVGPVILGPLDYSHQWGEFGSANGEFFQPSGIAVNRAGQIYVADTLNNRVQKFATDGTFIAAWGTSGAGNGQFASPIGVAVDSVGNVFVADSNNNRVQEFAADGAYLGQFGSAGTGNGQFDQPQGLALDDAGNIYVADLGNNRVQKFSSSGVFVTAWGTLGTGAGQLYQPRGLAVSAAGRVYVADTNNNRVQEFTSAGAFVAQWGSFGDTDATFNTLYGIATDAAGNVYVADTANNRVQKFEADGAFVSAWGTFGAGDGEFYYPAALAVDSTGRVFVADTFNDRVQVFAPMPALFDVPADGPYREGQALDFTVEYSTPVVVTGTPRIALTIGVATVFATYDVSSSSGATVIFRYTVQAGDTDSDGIAVSSVFFDLNGGSIRDAAGNDGTLAFASPAMPNVVVDTTAPSAPSISGISSDDGYSSSDGFTSDATLLFSGSAEANSTVTLDLAGSGTIGTTVANGSGAWTFDYRSTTLADGGHVFTVTATDAAGNISASSASFTVTILHAPVIDSATIAGGTYGSVFSYTITATQSPTGFSASALPAGLSIDTSTGAISGTPTETGVFNVTVGASNQISSDTTSLTLTIAKAAGSVTLGSLTQTYAGSPLAATATTTPSGLTVDITYDGGTIAPTNAGSYAVVATINDANYAGSASGTLEISPATQAISFGTLSDKTYGDVAFAVSATASSNLPVSFSILSGPATIAGDTVTITGAGVVTVRATQSGNANFTAAASVDRSFAVAKAAATVVLSNLAQTYSGSPLVAAAATNPSGLTVNLTYDGSATAPTDAGSYAVVGTINDANYQGSASDTLVIGKATATVTLSNLAQTYSGSPLVAVATTNPSGLTVNFTYDGSATAPTGAGSYVVVGTINDANYQGSASGTLVIGKASATVTLSDLSAIYDGAVKSVAATTAPVGLTVNLTYDSNATAPTNAGSYAVVATVNDANYSGGTTGTLTIAKADQTITFGALPDRVAEVSSFALTATSTSALPVSFAVTSGPATVSGATLSLTGIAGTVTVRASQVGNANYNAASDVTRSFLAVAATAGESDKLVDFGGTDGGTPAGSLIEGPGGLLYGTTSTGGALGHGTLFCVNPDGTGYTVLHDFADAPSDGAMPAAGLLLGSDGLLYGTTSAGGSDDSGTVFAIAIDGSGYAVLHNFAGAPSDGSAPRAELTEGPDGRVYGTTSAGGVNDAGTLFALNHDGSGYGVLHSFAGAPTEGAVPSGPLTFGSDGRLYGTTENGGALDAGTVYAIAADGSGFVTLHSFNGPTSDGSHPHGGVVAGPDGRLYGTTSDGGTHDLGTIFTLDLDGSDYAVLHDFAGGSTDGAHPAGGLLVGSDGNLYGTASGGGVYDQGVVFGFDPLTDEVSILTHFDGGNGASPAGGLIEGRDGSIYGTASGGGANNAGTLFTVTPSSAPAMTSAGTASGGLGESFSFTVTGNRTPTSFSATGLPAGLTIDPATGVISGSPTEGGEFDVSITATNAYGTETATLHLVIGKLAQTITFAVLADKQTGDASFTPQAASDSGMTVTFAIVSGPATISGSSVMLSGAPGRVIIAARQSGNGAYNAAAQVMRSFAVVAPQPLNFFGQVNDGADLAGDFAIYLNADGTAGTMIGYLPGVREGFVAHFTPDANGAFVATSMAVTGHLQLTFRGSLAGGSISGTVDGFGYTFSAIADASTGTASTQAGYYTSSPLDSTVGTIHTIIGASGDVYVLAVMPNFMSGAVGAMTMGSPSFSVATDGGASISGLVEAQDHTVRGTVERPNTSPTNFAGLLVSLNRTDRLVNYSSRGRVGTGADVLIAGFVVSGSTPQRVLLRAVGPGLAPHGLQDLVTDPRLQLYNAAGALVAANDNWNSAQTGDLTVAVQAFALTVGSTDAAVEALLAPGAYTMHVSAAAGSGVALAEVYDASESGEALHRLVNVSTRGRVEAGERVLIGGFVVAGNAPKRVLIRGVGPALAGFGLPGALTDPVLRLFDGEGRMVAGNDDWENPQPLLPGDEPALAAMIADAAARAQAFALTPGSTDAALLMTLAPGIYTAQVSGATGAAGIALIEVYEVSSP